MIRGLTHSKKSVAFVTRAHSKDKVRVYNSDKPNTKIWNDPKQLREFLDFAAIQLHIQKPEDWYKISNLQIKSLGGKALFNYYSLADALSVAYPNNHFVYLLFNKSPNNTWKNPEHLRDFFDYAAKQLNIQKPEDWYQVATLQLKSIGGSSISSYYSSLADALCVAYPEYKWIHCLFLRTPGDTWKDPKHLREFFDYAEQKLNIKKPEDWYNISQQQIQSLSGSSLSHKYNSLAEALSVAYPSYKWVYCLFLRSPINSWKDPKHLQEFFEYISRKLDITKPEDWYNISQQQIQVIGGSTLWQHHYCLADALSMAYPDYNWIHCLFLRTPISKWKDPKHLRKFLDYCATELDVQNPDDWSRISIQQIHKLGGATIFKQFSNLGEALTLAYPEYTEAFTSDNYAFKGKKSSQRWLIVQLKKLLPIGTQILEDYEHPSLTWEGNPYSKKMQLDIWVPSLNLAIEYQGEHHFNDVNAFGQGGSLSVTRHRDQLKHETVALQNINLITIPYWWDGTVSSLASTLHFHLPTLFPVTKHGFYIKRSPQ